MIELICSGGQTGADFGGLEAALQFGIPTGGWVPKGYRTENGPNLELKKLGLKETETNSYVPRTKLNIRDSDGTIRFATNWKSRGEICTLRGIKEYKKPYIDVDPRRSFSHQLQDVVNWIKENNIRTLNVAGNRESKSPGIQQYVVNFLLKIFEKLNGI
jgi:hypothetical protein